MPKYVCWKCGKTVTTIIGQPIQLKTCSGGTTTGLSYHSYNEKK